MVRSAIESLYKGLCTIRQYDSVVDPVTKRTYMAEVVSHTNLPCRLSYSSDSSAKQSDTVTNVAQVIKLFIAPEITIDAGSKIQVTQNGVTKSYVASGEPLIYTNHQEVVLEIEDDEA